MFIEKSKISLSILSIIIVIAFLASNLFSYYTTKKTLISEIRGSSLPLLSENIYSEIQRSLSLPINVSSTMAHDSFLINWINNGEKNPGEIRQYLNKIKSKYGFFSSFFISANSETYYYYDGILKEISKKDPHDIWYYDFVSSGKEIDLDVDTDEASSGILTIFINTRVEDFKGNFIGVTGVGIRLDRVAEKFREKKEKYNRKVYLIDETGTVQVHSDISLVEKENIFNKEGIKIIAENLMNESDKPVDKIYTDDSGDIMISSRYIPELGWHVIVEQDKSSSYNYAKKSLFINLFIMALITALLFFVSFIILKNFKREMEFIAGTDTLTGAANRRKLIKQFNLFEYRAKRYKSRFCIIIIDLDDFKIINDKYGHLAGDNLLKDIADRINELIRPVDLLSRWGGDEFVILIEASLDEAAGTAERIRQSCSSISLINNIPVSQSPTISVGISEYTEGETLDQLTTKADQALYESKKKGKNRISIN